MARMKHICIALSGKTDKIVINWKRIQSPISIIFVVFPYLIFTGKMNLRVV